MARRMPHPATNTFYCIGTAINKAPPLVKKIIISCNIGGRYHADQIQTAMAPCKFTIANYRHTISPTGALFYPIAAKIGGLSPKYDGKGF